MKAEQLARVERKIRPFMTRLPPSLVVPRYSKGRLDFLARLKEEIPTTTYFPHQEWNRVLWGIRFRSPIFNAAGLFKNAECYELVARQGAGAYLGGTGTWNARQGNVKDGVHLPFAPYPQSHSASNWLGLPNDGDRINSDRASQLTRIGHTPVGWSVMGSPDFQGEVKLNNLVEGLRLYAEAGVDFLEQNESCPNTAHGAPQNDDLAHRLRYVQENFLDRRTRKVPLIAKFSNDTDVKQVPYLLDLLFEYGYDGVNFGNTSINYARIREQIAPSERKLFDYFTSTFGGGISGKPLRESSLELASQAVEYMKKGGPSQEFHVIRTGGIETLKDIIDSERAGISLNQWYTGYFENFSQFGHEVYRQLFKDGRFLK